ncbi:MAG: alpha-amylase family glycosyl hydrolase [Candidatus Thermoplasmatota archaeon]|nr:alpha-amylase family glycosyl hydrolase [Candidatus Thermoplasmatota archaeon]
MGGVGWFRNAIIYQILIDRFSGFKNVDGPDKPDFIGGNLNGIIEKIPYLRDLGVNTIWISPFYKTNAYHGYHITDFYQVEPHFGTKKDIERLIKTVHKNDMHIIADFVPNHCSNQHPFFIEAQQDINSEYRKWFYFKKWPSDYLCFLSIGELPKINLDYALAKNYIIDAAKYWLSLGFDGFRLDHVIGPSHRFWKEFRKEVKEEFPETVLIGEAWMMGIKFKELKTINVRWKFLKWFFGSSPDYLLRSYIGELDGVLDFKMQELLKQHIAWKPLYHSKQLLWNEIKKHYGKYPDGYFLPVFLDNHDMNRFLFECGNDDEKLKVAAEIQFSNDQPAVIYYGTETGMTQDKSIWEIARHGDLQARKPMNWKKQDKELLSFYKKLI